MANREDTVHHANIAERILTRHDRECEEVIGSNICELNPTKAVSSFYFKLDVVHTEHAENLSCFKVVNNHCAGRIVFPWAFCLSM